MRTGNLRNWRPLTICVQLTTAAQGNLATNAAGETYLASFLGWHRGTKIVADGPTEAAAIRRLGQLTEIPSASLATCPILHDEP